MNKRGTLMVIVLFAFIYFFFGMMLYQFIKPDITIARTDLSCSSPSTSGDMVTCLIIDGVIPAIVIGILATAGGVITDRGLK